MVFEPTSLFFSRTVFSFLFSFLVNNRIFMASSSVSAEIEELAELRGVLEDIINEDDTTAIILPFQ